MRKKSIATIVGARPQFIKAALFSRLWRRRHKEILIHTGQHYDVGMSDIFFRQLGIPKPDYSLNIGSGPHGQQTGKMMEAIERVLLHRPVDGVLVYGDTNSALAGALAAVKLNIPVFHVESGLRSFNREMPEEINRVTVDHLSSLLFAPTEAAIVNLRNEGLAQNVHRVGDVMLDIYKHYAGAAKNKTSSLLTQRPYAFATVHRPASTDDLAALASLCRAFNRLPIPVIWPVHPRTRKALQTQAIPVGKNIRLIEPIGYLESLAYQRAAEVILTDSGGIQKEAYFARRPCVTLRKETEWIETVQTGHNIVAGTGADNILRAVKRVCRHQSRPWPAVFGTGCATQRIAELISRHLQLLK